MSSIQKNTTTKSSNNYQVKKDKSLLYIKLAVLGFFVGLFMIFGFYSITIISFFTLSKFIIGFSIIGFLIPLKYYQKWFQFIKYEMIIFNVIGVGPVFTGLFLLLNFTFSLSTNVKKYKIEQIYFDGGNQIGVILKDNAYSRETRIIEFPYKRITEIKHNQTLKLTLNTGIFGFQVIKNRELIN